MKTKILASALTLSLPMIFGAAYAQTTTDAQTGTNRSGDGNATAVTPPASSAGGPVSAPGTEPEANTGASTTAGSGTTGTAATGAAGTNAATGSAGTDAAMPGSATATTEAITGLSVNDDVIGKSVYNENDEKIGDINDVVIASDGRSTYVLIGAGGFLGMGEKNVAVPFDRIQRSDDRILLSGYTKDQLKALPEVRTD